MAKNQVNILAMAMMKRIVAPGQPDRNSHEAKTEENPHLHAAGKEFGNKYIGQETENNHGAGRRALRMGHRGIGIKDFMKFFIQIIQGLQLMTDNLSDHHKDDHLGHMNGMIGDPFQIFGHKHDLHGPWV